MQNSTPPTYSNLTSTAPNLIPCPAPVAKVWTPSKRPRPLCHGDMSALDVQEGVIPVYDVQYMPFSDGRYKKFVESQQDYARGGYAKVTLGQRINYERYEITAKLGVGHFGVVYLAWDRIDGRYVAIKIVRSSVKYARAAMAEDKLLTVIQGPMDDRKEYLVEYLDCFELETVDGAGDLFHVCLVFEVLGMSLLEVLRKNEFNGFPLRTAKHFIRQILQSISYLHSMDIIHTDIKPDNILLSHGSEIESMLTAQLRAQARIAEEELQAEIDAGFDPLNTAGRVKTWLDYYKKIPGATHEQEEMIAKKRFEVESRKWQIIKSTPVESGIEFMKGTMIPYRPSRKVTNGKAKEGSEKGKDKESPPVQHTQGLGETIKRSKAPSTTTQQRSSPSHPSCSASKPKIVPTSNFTATASQNTTASSSITQPPSAPPPFNYYSENADTPDKPSQPSVWDQAIADSGYNGNRIFPLTPEEMALSAGLRNGGYNTGFKPPLLYSGLSTRNSSASPSTRLHKDFENISLGLASYQRDDDAENDDKDPNDDFGVDMLEMRPRRPLTRNGSQRSIAGSISSNGSSSSNLASGGSSLFTNRTGGTIGTATTAGAPYNYGYGTPTVTSSPEFGFTKSPPMALGISGLHRATTRHIPFASPSSSSQGGQATLYNNSTGFSCPSPETALSGLPMHNQQQQQFHAASPRQHSGSSTASPLSHLSNYFISPTSLALNGQRAFPYTSLSGSPAQSFVPTMTSMGMSAELASTSSGERHGQPMMGLGLAFAQQQQYLHGTGPAASTAVKPFSTPPPKRADTSTTSLQSQDSTSASTPTCGTPDAQLPTSDDAPSQKVLPDLSNSKIKLADLGNAIFFGEMKGRNNLPEFVCTRQYRPPENLIGAPYDQGIDIWATACVVFEMLTGDLLFNPGSKRFKWSKEDDLLAQQIELLGPLPQHLLNAGKKTSHYFNSNGKLLKLKLKPWSLKDVLVEKYKMSPKQAEELTDFLLPMLAMDPAARCSADEALAHPWLSSDPDDDTILYRTPPPVLKLADPEVERKKREERALAREKEDALLIQWQEEARRREEEYDRLQDEKRRLQEEEEDKRHWAQIREIERRRDGIYDPPKEEDDNTYPWGYPLRRYP